MSPFAPVYTATGSGTFSVSLLLDLSADRVLWRTIAYLKQAAKSVNKIIIATVMRTWTAAHCLLSAYLHTTLKVRHRVCAF